MKVFNFKRFMELQCEEIKKHKWIESEKAGYDLGKKAETDWIKKYAVEFSIWAHNNIMFYKEE